MGTQMDHSTVVQYIIRGQYTLPARIKIWLSLSKFQEQVTWSKVGRCNASSKQKITSIANAWVYDLPNLLLWSQKRSRVLIWSWHVTDYSHSKQQVHWEKCRIWRKLEKTVRHQTQTTGSTAQSPPPLKMSSKYMFTTFRSWEQDEKKNPTDSFNYFPFLLLNTLK